MKYVQIDCDIKHTMQIACVHESMDWINELYNIILFWRSSLFSLLVTMLFNDKRIACAAAEINRCDTQLS